jgi:hypothetical protein
MRVWEVIVESLIGPCDQSFAPCPCILMKLFLGKRVGATRMRP